MMRVALLFLTFALALPAQIVVLQNATLIDGSGAPPQAGQSLVLSGGKIQQIGPAGSVDVPSGAQVIDASGKYIIPGIINLHGHVGSVKGLVQARENYTRENALENLRTYARYGVTTTTSLGTDEDLILELRDDQRRGKIGGARVYTALQGFTTRNGYPTQAPGVKGVAQEAATAAQARAWVDKLAGKGADMVKMWVDDHHDEFSKLTPELFGAIIKQARKRGLLSFAHVYELSDAKALVKAGVDVLAHSVRDKEVDQELISLIKENGVIQVPTLTREKSTYIYAESPVWLDDPFFKKAVSDDLIQQLKTTLKQQQASAVEQGKKDYGMASRNLNKLAGAGVTIGFGTDTGPPARFPGFFEHWEMELMVESGMTPMQVIESFSKNAAKALRIEKEFGTLAKGKAADLIVLNRNPLDDIRNTRSIHSVYLAGKQVK